MGAHVCVNRSLKLAPASIVAPYQYTLILWAAVFGYFVFGDLLQARTLVGAFLIIGSGLYLASQSRDSSGAKAAGSRAA